MRDCDSSDRTGVISLELMRGHKPPVPFSVGVRPYLFFVSVRAKAQPPIFEFRHIFPEQVECAKCNKLCGIPPPFINFELRYYDYKRSLSDHYKNLSNIRWTPWFSFLQFTESNIFPSVVYQIQPISFMASGKNQHG